MRDRKGNRRPGPFRFIARMVLEVVGQDWDGTFKLIDQLKPRKRRNRRGKK